MTPREAALAMLADMTAQAAADDERRPSVLLCFDPETGTYSARGPFPDGVSAFAAIDGWRSELEPGLDPGGLPWTFHVAPLYDCHGNGYAPIGATS